MSRTILASILLLLSLLCVSIGASELSAVAATTIVKQTFSLKQPQPVLFFARFSRKPVTVRDDIELIVDGKAHARGTAGNRDSFYLIYHVGVFESGEHKVEITSLKNETLAVDPNCDAKVTPFCASPLIVLPLDPLVATIEQFSDDRQGCPAGGTELIRRKLEVVSTRSGLLVGHMMRVNAPGAANLFLNLDGNTLDMAPSYADDAVVKDVLVSYMGTLSKGSHNISLETDRAGVFGCTPLWGTIYALQFNTNAYLFSSSLDARVGCPAPLNDRAGKPVVPLSTYSSHRLIMSVSQSVPAEAKALIMAEASWAPKVVASGGTSSYQQAPVYLVVNGQYVDAVTLTATNKFDNNWQRAVLLYSGPVAPGTLKVEVVSPTEGWGCSTMPHRPGKIDVLVLQDSGPTPAPQAAQSGKTAAGQPSEPVATDAPFDPCTEGKAELEEMRIQLALDREKLASAKAAFDTQRGMNAQTLSTKRLQLSNTFNDFSQNLQAGLRHFKEELDKQTAMVEADLQAEYTNTSARYNQERQDWLQRTSAEKDLSMQIKQWRRQIKTDLQVEQEITQAHRKQMKKMEKYFNKRRNKLFLDILKLEEAVNSPCPCNCSAASLDPDQGEMQELSRIAAKAAAPVNGPSAAPTLFSPSYDPFDPKNTPQPYAKGADPIFDGINKIFKDGLSQSGPTPAPDLSPQALAANPFLAGFQLPIPSSSSPSAPSSPSPATPASTKVMPPSASAVADPSSSPSSSPSSPSRPSSSSSPTLPSSSNSQSTLSPAKL